MTTSPDMDAMRAVLRETIKILFPLSVEPDDVIIPHVWRNKRYVGEHCGRIAAWKGWSANLQTFHPRYSTLYIDQVENSLSEEAKLALFGQEFARRISGNTPYVVMFVLGFPVDTEAIILWEGFIPRRLSERRLHACVVNTVDEFLSQPTLVWAALCARLLNLQKELMTL
jgi:hypothetical protein